MLSFIRQTLRAVARSGPVLVGIRPEKVHLVAPGTGEPADSTLLGPGMVADVSFSGVLTAPPSAGAGSSARRASGARCGWRGTTRPPWPTLGRGT